MSASYQNALTGAAI